MPRYWLTERGKFAYMARQYPQSVDGSILKQLGSNRMGIDSSDIAEKTFGNRYNPSFVASRLNVLEDAGLVTSEPPNSVDVMSGYTMPGNLVHTFPDHVMHSPFHLVMMPNPDTTVESEEIESLRDSDVDYRERFSNS